MKILILQGPNLNLLGLKSSKLGEKYTLDKLNRDLRRYVRGTNINFKILQTHKRYLSLNFIHYNRTLADALLIIPTSWAKNNWELKEAIDLIDIKTAAIYFNENYSFGTSQEESIFVSKNIKPFTGNPLESCIDAIDYLKK